MAILGGLGAALAWAVTLLCTSRATRMIGSGSVLAWVMLAGFCIVVPWAALEGIPDGLDGTSVAWLLVAGLGNVLGLLLVYTALRLGNVGIVGPIVSTEGAIAALLAVLAGEHLAAGSAAMLVLIAVGIALAATTAESTEPTRIGRIGAVPAYALLAACAFGVSIYATGRASAELPIGWAVAPATHPRSAPRDAPTRGDGTAAADPAGPHRSSVSPVSRRSSASRALRSDRDTDSRSPPFSRRSSRRSRLSPPTSSFASACPGCRSRAWPRSSAGVTVLTALQAA